MTWTVVAYVETEAEATALHDDLDATPGARVVHYELCDADFMAGQLCQLPAGHQDNEGTPHQ